MERKEYTIIGKVEIGTDEYRDLIEAVKDSEERMNRANSDYWKEYTRANKVEGELKELQDKYNTLVAFVNSNEELNKQFQLFKFENFNKE